MRIAKQLRFLVLPLVILSLGFLSAGCGGSDGSGGTDAGAKLSPSEDATLDPANDSTRPTSTDPSDPGITR